MQSTTEPHPIWNDDPTPDVWWGEDGIDALIWADPPPYEPPSLGVPADPTLVMAEVIL